MLTDKDVALLITLSQRAPKYPHEELELNDITNRMYREMESRNRKQESQNGSVPPEQEAEYESASG